MVQVDEIPVRLSGARERASGGTDEPVETAMKTFEFRVIASGPDLERDEVFDRLYEAGCDDATIGVQNGLLVFAFAREGACLDDAVVSAVADVRAAGATVDRVEPSLYGR
jgi:hypothetical protein